MLLFDPISPSVDTMKTGALLGNTFHILPYMFIFFEYVLYSLENTMVNLDADWSDLNCVGDLWLKVTRACLNSMYQVEVGGRTLGRGSGPTWDEAKQQVSEYLKSSVVVSDFYSDVLLCPSRAGYYFPSKYPLKFYYSFYYAKCVCYMLYRQQKKLMWRWRCHYGHISEGMGHRGFSCFPFFLKC